MERGGDLDLGFDVVDRVAALDLEGDGLPSEGFHEDLHRVWARRCLGEVWVREGVLSLLSAAGLPPRHLELAGQVECLFI